MAAAVVYEGAVQRSQPAVHGLFAGQKLWFSHSVPARKWLIENAEANGAQVVQFDHQADVKLVDHAKKNQAPGTHSYRYVEISIRNGKLEDLDAHRVGSATRSDRVVGDVITAPKGNRNKFTPGDDQILWNWIKPCVDASGSWKGNEIYKQLEAAHPQHTFQSWRDRWMRYVQFQNRQITNEPRADGVAVQDQVEESIRSPKRRRVENENPVMVEQTKFSGAQTQERPTSSSLKDGRSTDATKQFQSDKTAIVVGDVHLASNYSTTKEAHGETRSPKTNQIQPRPQDQSQSTEALKKNVESIGLDMSNRTDKAKNNASAEDKQRPSAFNVTLDVTRLLYSHTCKIINTRPDKLDDYWSRMAENFGHTKEAWSRYFNKTVIPEYMKRHGLRTEDELTFHCKEVLQNRREPSVVAAQQEKNMTQGSRAGLENEANESESAQVDVATLIHHNPPQPNERRKLSQSKGPHSASSQSSQQSMQPNKARIIASQKELPAMQVSPMLKDRQQPRSALDEAPGPSLLTEPESDAPLQVFDIPSTTQRSESRENSSGQFVTQVSNNPAFSSIDGGSELEEIPYQQPTATSRPMTTSESPLFVPLEPRGSLPKSVQNLGDSESVTSDDGLGLVRLVDMEGETEAIEIESSSEDELSEGQTESVAFEDELKLCEAWDTVPDDVRGEGRALTVTSGEQDDLNVYDTRETSTFERPDLSSFGQSLAFETAKPVSSASSIEDEFETAPQVRSIPQTQNASEIFSEPLTKNNNRIRTEALLHQPTLANIAGLAATTEPPSAWGDGVVDGSSKTGDDLNGTQEKNIGYDSHVSEMMEDNQLNENVDWTLPLPDIELDIEVDKNVVAEHSNRPSNSTNEMAPRRRQDKNGVADKDMASWLADQLHGYPAIPPFLLRPFSHRALESTSMDLDVADRVLVHMVDEFGTRQQRPAAGIKKLPRHERKAVIATLADDLLPTEMAGCWTRQDDAALLGVDGRLVKRVEDKHGAAAVRTRFEFLEVWMATTAASQ